jgi:hypothetical protein
MSSDFLDIKFKSDSYMDTLIYCCVLNKEKSREIQKEKNGIDACVSLVAADMLLDEGVASDTRLPEARWVDLSELNTQLDQQYDAYTQELFKKMNYDKLVSNVQWNFSKFSQNEEAKDNVAETILELVEEQENKEIQMSESERFFHKLGQALMLRGWKTESEYAKQLANELKQVTS